MDPGFRRDDEVVSARKELDPGLRQYDEIEDLPK